VLSRAKFRKVSVQLSVSRSYTAPGKTSIVTACGAIYQEYERENAIYQLLKQQESLNTMNRGLFWATENKYPANGE